MSRTTRNVSDQSSARPPHLRHRSTSDPFVDPIYAAPYVPYSDQATHPNSAPLPASFPPKSNNPKKNRLSNDPRDRRMLESAVRDTVTVRGVDQSPRAKMARSQTGGGKTAGANTTGSRPAPAPTRRSYSQDSVTQAANIVEKSRKTPKKGSTHADIIDRLDFSGVGPMLHHDGPFDACAPSRNRQKNKAPMLAWSTPADERDDPVSATQYRAADRRLSPVDNLTGSYDSPYPAFGSGYAGPGESDIYSKKQVDRIAEAWGIHEPEPYEEFFAGGGAKPNGETGLASAASSIHGKEGYTTNGTRKSTRDGRELREQFREQLEDSRSPHYKRTGARTTLPPPQPIFLPGESTTDVNVMSASLPSPGVSSPGAPKRSRSLMHRIRKMRDAPNVPVDAAEAGEDPSPPSSLENYGAPSVSTAEGRASRPAHRTSNSFFGRFGRGPSVTRNGPTSPVSDVSTPFVYVEDPTFKNKALPPPPEGSKTPQRSGERERDYFDAPSSPNGAPVSPGGNGGLGRRTSLLKKVKGAVRNK